MIFDSRFYTALLNRAHTARLTDAQKSEDTRRAVHVFSQFGEPSKYMSPTNQHIISGYTASNSNAIGKGFVDPSDKTASFIKNFAEILHSPPTVFRPQQPLTVFTGAGAHKTRDLIDSLTQSPFSHIDFLAPISATPSAYEASSFAASVNKKTSASPFALGDRVKLILALHLPKTPPGVSTAGLSLAPHEMEVVLPPGIFSPESIHLVSKLPDNSESYMIGGVYTPHPLDLVHSRIDNGRQQNRR